MTNALQSTSSQQALQTAGKVYLQTLQNPTWGPGRAPVMASLQAASTHTLPTSLRTAAFGANVQRALATDPVQTRSVLLAIVSNCLEMVGAANGVKSEEAIARLAKMLADDFGHFTIEDWQLCTSEMAKGKSVNHYNNTNLEWFMKCFQAYDERKVEAMRQLHTEQATVHQRETATMFQMPLQDAIGDRERAPRSLATFIAGADGRITFDEREAMARRDVARRDAKVKQQMREMVRAQMRAERKKP